MKFQAVNKKTRTNKYIVNKPRTTAQNKGFCQSETIQTQPIQKKNDKGAGYGQIRRSIIRSSLSKNIKPEDANTSLSRATLYKMKKVSTENNLSSNNIQTLKNYIRNVNNTSNFLQNRLTYISQSIDPEMLRERKQENKRFMMAHLSFAQIEEQKITNQKDLLRAMKQSLKNTSKMISIKAVDYSTQKHQQYLLGSFKNIDKIYKVLDQMNELGYVAKSNKYMINFCVNVRFWLSQVFLSESKDKKDAFALKAKYFVISSAEEVKMKLSEYLIKDNSVDLSVVAHDVQELLDHIESTLSLKNIQQMTNVESYIQSRLDHHKKKDNYQRNQLRIANYTPQRFDFCKSIGQMQEKYGPMREISKVSRSRFQDLNRTFQRLQCLA